MGRPDVYVRHVRFRDVCIYVPMLRLFGGNFKGKGTFWNMGYDRPFDMVYQTKVHIASEDLVNWEYIYGEPLRKGEWRSCSSWKTDR